MSIATEMLKYQGRLFIYIYMNLQAATVFDSKGSDISMSYSLKLNRYPFVFKKVKMKAKRERVIEHSAGAVFIIPIFP